MKKVLSLLLAVVLVCSMATVALAATEKVCDICGFVTDSAVAYNKHIREGGCGRCEYCGNGFETADELKEHQKDYCLHFEGTCDYCGKTDADIDDPDVKGKSTKADFDAHVEKCKAKYYNIPLAKIIATVKDLISKIDFEKVLGTVKDLGGKAVSAISGLIK